MTDNCHVELPKTTELSDSEENTDICNLVESTMTVICHSIIYLVLHWGVKTRKTFGIQKYEANI